MHGNWPMSHGPWPLATSKAGRFKGMICGIQVKCDEIYTVLH